MSTTEPPNPDRSSPSRAGGGSSTTRGVILEIRTSSIVVTVMPSDAAPYRARVAVSPERAQPELRIGSHVELVVGDEPGEIRLAEDRPPAA